MIQRPLFWPSPVLWTLALVTLVSIAAVAGYLYFVSGNETLAQIHASIERGYKGLKHIDAHALEAMTNTDAVIFDVREAREFAVSHLPGAIRLPPKTSASDFEERFGDRIEGKRVIFYCSVGRRATRMLKRVNSVIESRSASGYNLKGGIFNWHNEERALRRGDVETDFVHPFGSFLVPLLKREQMVRFKADGKS